MWGWELGEGGLKLAFEVGFFYYVGNWIFVSHVLLRIAFDLYVECGISSIICADLIFWNWILHTKNKGLIIFTNECILVRNNFIYLFFPLIILSLILHTLQNTLSRHLPTKASFITGLRILIDKQLGLRVFDFRIFKWFLNDLSIFDGSDF